jgi:hypothetical protein
MQGSRCNGKCSYQSIAFGTTVKKQIFGRGGNSSDAMLFEAKRNLYRAFPLRKGEFYDNFVVDYKTTYYPFCTKTQVTVTADIILENGSTNDELFSENYILSVNAGKITSVDHLKLADSVVYLQGCNSIKGIIIDFKDKAAIVLINNTSGNQVFIDAPTKKLFSIGSEDIEEICGFEAGQVLEISSSNAKKDETYVKEIIGLRADKALISTTTKKSIKYKVVSIEDLKNTNY